MRRRLGLLLGLWGCGGEDLVVPPTPYANELVSFSPGPGAGFGQDRLPEVVFGPPDGADGGAGSLDVLSLGQGGAIVLGFAGRAIRDRAGPDFVIFENAFWVKGDPAEPYAELAEVSVSADGETFETFVCETEGAGAGRYPGCAGWSPTARFDTNAKLDPETSGGDAFDLAELGLSAVRYVRIVDRGSASEGPSAGFDLDAVGAVELEASP